MAEERSSGSRSRLVGVAIVGTLFIISLIIVGVILILGNRDGSNQAENGGQPAATASAEDGSLVIPGEISLTGSDGSVALSSLDGAAFAVDEDWASAAGALPAGSQIQGKVYLLSSEGSASGTIKVMAPAGSDPTTLDLYGWNGQSWAFMPTTHNDNGELVAAPAGFPQALTLLQLSATPNKAIGSEVLPTQTLPTAILPYLTEVTAGTLTLEGSQLSGSPVTVPTGGYKQYIRVTNTGVIVDQVSLTSLLNDPNLIQQHVSAIVQAAAGYQGVNLDYQGVPAGTSPAFTSLISDLANALHAANQDLIVTLNTPTNLGNNNWDSGGQNWAAIGQLADAIYLQLPLDPTAYSEGGLTQQLLDWAVGQIPRQKISLLTTANAIDAIGGTTRELSNNEALANFGEISFIQGGTSIAPGTAVEVGLTGSASPLQWDTTNLMYSYGYEQAGQNHTVWLGNEAALNQRLLNTGRYNLRGVAVRGLGNVSDGAGYATVFESYLHATAGPAPAGAAIVWTVANDQGGIVASSNGESLSYRWEETNQPGQYTIHAEFAQGQAIAELGTIDVQVAAPATPTPMPTETAVAIATSAPIAGGGTVQITPAPIDPGDANAVTNTPANLRTGPGLSYGVVEVVPTGAQVALIGRNNGADWLKVQVLTSNNEGWLFRPLLNINSTVDVNSLAVIAVEPPVAGGGGSGGSGGSGGTTPPPVATGNFQLGGQAFGAPYSMMNYAGMTWIKRQHKWSPGQTGQEVAGLISEAHNGGFRILLSIPGAQHGSSIDFAAYAQFVGAVAALPDPPDAIEVWNEMNIDREWPSGQISPTSYVQNMLIPAYNAINAANSNVMVVSGAPSPTGFWGGGCGGGGCDDAPYVQGMAGAGAASYMDCIGIHYNEGIISPTLESGDPRGNSGHYTRYFWGMVNTYYNAFGGSRQLCFTELGYLSPEGYGGLPGGFSWASNVTVAQQAQWLAEAASLSANSGKVRFMIVWNIDSTTWDSDPQAGYAIIRPGGGCPACDTLRQVMGGG